MDYNQLKALGSYCRAAGPHVHRARTVYRRAAGPHVHRVRTIVLQDRTNSQFVVSVLYQFVVSRFVERGFVCLLLSFL